MKNLIDDLTYINYKTNRDANPKIDAYRWQIVYGKQAIEMEKKYQQELKKTK